MPAPAPHDCNAASRLADLLADDAVDAALEAGLMQFIACASCDARCAERIDAAKLKLAAAWAARDRHRARSARLARIAAEREARRTPPPAAEKAAALPASAAAILARVKARTAERHKP